ncbi:N-acetylmuramoyl-L-alanine amidase [Maribacter algarum]|uniref:N-acetylmuramoyl-L-alanine amidase n=1 Tax=Maribacter algarum (ex Zhang et al. 2020) TaxID=2578118 RepID=A0A5S3PRT8_9FLAO|nr:peptidoglycan recognition family protein [Maribacter algarum]TMM57349.1 N-acetylmuramoyl-L-alanine amidase [Maribacter algarum]
MRYLKSVFAGLSIILFFACKTEYKIIDKPIIFDEERKQLTLQYLEDRYGLKQSEPTIDPKMIVLHWTVIPTFEESFETFNSSTLPSRPDIKAASTLNVSSQFMVDRDGTIYRLLPETTMARHVIGLNHCSIGVENIGGTEDLPLTEAQLKSNIWLVNYLSKKYAIDYLIGHYEYTLFEGHELWLEKDDGYRTEKTDPGEDFMGKVREAIKKKEFQPLPKIRTEKIE